MYSNKDNNKEIIRRMDKQIYYIKKIQGLEEEKTRKQLRGNMVKKKEGERLFRNYEKLKKAEFSTDEALSQFNSVYSEAMRNRFKTINPIVLELIHVQINNYQQIYDKSDWMMKNREVLLKKNTDNFYNELEKCRLLEKRMSISHAEMQQSQYKEFFSFKEIDMIQSIEASKKENKANNGFYVENSRYGILDDKAPLKEEKKEVIHNFMEDSDSHLKKVYNQIGNTSFTLSDKKEKENSQLKEMYDSNEQIMDSKDFEEMFDTKVNKSEIEKLEEVESLHLDDESFKKPIVLSDYYNDNIEEKHIEINKQ